MKIDSNPPIQYYGFNWSVGIHMHHHKVFYFSYIISFSVNAWKYEHCGVCIICRVCRKAITTSQRLQISFVEIGKHIFKLKIQKGTCIGDRSHFFFFSKPKGLSALTRQIIKAPLNEYKCTCSWEDKIHQNLIFILHQYLTINLKTLISMFVIESYITGMKKKDN